MIRLLVLVLLLALPHAGCCFVSFLHTTIPSRCCHHTHCKALPTPEESAKVLTDYMAKAHEEKIRAMAAIEAKYKDRIQVRNCCSLFKFLKTNLHFVVVTHFLGIGTPS
jgi:hypothetical protein